jgi:tripartite-type tricarboxylate transporter receptor subunit TctC
LPETQQRFATLGATVACGGSKDLETVVTADYERWGRVIKQGGIKGE